MTREPVTSPFVSIVVRSFNRVPALCDLLAALLAQRWPSFEVVVVEQSTRVPPDAAKRLAELERDERIVLVRRPPLGGAAARNLGVERARGEIFLFIDDDDLPAGDDWIEAHVRALDDPRCVGVSGRHIHNDEPDHVDSRVARALTGTLGFDPLLKSSLTYVQHGQRTIPVFALHGTNASLRRSAWERFGGWDEDTAIEDEVSFCYRALRRMRPGEYFAYDPRPTIVRNRDVAGGLDKRHMTVGVYFAHYMNFVHRIIGRYYRARVVFAYPLYVVLAYFMSIGWLWMNSRRYRTTVTRLGAAATLLVGLPVHVLSALWRLGRPAAMSGKVAAARDGTLPAPAHPRLGAGPQRGGAAER